MSEPNWNEEEVLSIMAELDDQYPDVDEDDFLYDEEPR